MILLRGALTFLIHWEIKNEEARMGEAGEPAEAERPPEQAS